MRGKKVIKIIKSDGISKMMQFDKSRKSKRYDGKLKKIGSERERERERPQRIWAEVHADMERTEWEKSGSVKG